MTTIRQKLTAEERLWLNEMIDDHGEQHVLDNWSFLEAELAYVRDL